PMRTPHAATLFPYTTLFRSGRIARSATAKRQFEASHPCPTTGRTGACPGYVVDHIKPLACGGADSPNNMQWQSVAAAKAKDKWEDRKSTRLNSSHQIISYAA